MINIHLFMMFFCLLSMMFISWLYVKPTLFHDLDDPDLNRAYTPSNVITYYYAEDLGNTDKLQLKPANLIAVSLLGGCIYALLRVCNIAYRQTLITRGVA